MVRLTLVVITLVVISLMFMGISYAEIWYEEDFDDFKDGDVAGQDEWETVWDQESAVVQGDVAFGNTGKSLLVDCNKGGRMSIRNFPDAHAGIQHVSLHSRKDSPSENPMMYYIGGDVLGWGAAAVFVIKENIVSAIDGANEVNIAEVELGEWSYFHVVLDFDSQTFDFYVDGEQVADDFVFRGKFKGPKPNPSLDWVFLGANHGVVPLVAYLDNISIGTGEGDPSYSESAVSSSSKLATTWAELKR